MKYDLTLFEPYRVAIRARFRSATPFRIGIAVGEAGAGLPSPYPPGSRGTKNYLDGIEEGKARRARAASAQPDRSEES
ncbi:hypothetical protein [Methylibium petroleiphilum]